LESLHGLQPPLSAFDMHYNVVRLLYRRFRV
jgi:hypothetical protein